MSDYDTAIAAAADEIDALLGQALIHTDYTGTATPVAAGTFCEHRDETLQVPDGTTHPRTARATIPVADVATIEINDLITAGTDVWAVRAARKTDGDSRWILALEISEPGEKARREFRSR